MGRLIGPKPPLKLREIWAIRQRAHGDRIARAQEKRSRGPPHGPTDLSEPLPESELDQRVSWLGACLLFLAVAAPRLAQAHSCVGTGILTAELTRESWQSHRDLPKVLPDPARPLPDHSSSSPTKKTPRFFDTALNFLSFKVQAQVLQHGDPRSRGGDTAFDRKTNELIR